MIGAGHHLGAQLLLMKGAAADPAPPIAPAPARPTVPARAPGAEAPLAAHAAAAAAAPTPPPRSPRSPGSPPPWERRPQGPTGSTVYVGNLPDNTTAADLEDFFEQYGLVINVKLIFDHDTQAFRGFAFVTFERADDAELAVRSAHNAELLGNRIRCNIAKYNKAPGMRGGLGGRRGGGRGYRRYDADSPRRRFSDEDSPRRRYSDDVSPPPRRRSFSPRPSPSPRDRRGSYSMDRSPSPAYAKKRSPPADASPPRNKRRKRSVSLASSPSASSLSQSPSPARDRAAGRPAAAAVSAAAKAQLERELAAAVKEKDRVQGELERAQESIAQQADVIEKIRSHSQSRRVQMKALSLRSQKRGQLLLSMAEASAKVCKCKQAVKDANEALAAAEEELQRITVAAELYIKEEEEQRQAEEQKTDDRKGQDRSRAEASASQPEKKKDAPGEEAGAAAESMGNGLGFKLKPFKVSLA